MGHAQPGAHGTPCGGALSILALEPWLGGSHQLFLEQWRALSRHRVEILGLPPRHWKWRMRAAPWQLARSLAGRAGPLPHALLASDYLDLPGLLGFLPGRWSAVPTVLYLHENQLAYPRGPGPVEGRAERDLHHGFTNVLSCLRAECVVFNSHFHRASFTGAALELLRRLPRPAPRGELSARLEAAEVVAPGIDVDGIALGPGGPGPALRVAFNHRWEHDKDPAAFLRAVERVPGVELVLLGERYAALPAGVDGPLARLAPRIVHAGFAPDRRTYLELLGSCDVVVSTARQEFFGISVLEAAAAGCHPLLPDRLAYPELVPVHLRGRHLYADDEQLVAVLARAAADPRPLRSEDRRRQHRRLALPHGAEAAAAALDELFERVVEARAAKPRAIPADGTGSP